MKKFYEAPSVEITKFQTEDVLGPSDLLTGDSSGVTRPGMADGTLDDGSSSYAARP